MIAFSVETRRRKEMIDITAEVRKAAAGLDNGAVVVFVPHTTAGVTINENADPDVRRDLLAHMETLVPEDTPFAHGEGNSDAHVQATLTGSSVTVIMEKGRLMLGTWQSVFFCEFDGPRTRKVFVQTLAA
ncbi:MAG: secondary thiamine-phosphate synthase enzyme YjbQ [Thermodesulfobacteriota bacterium]